MKLSQILLFGVSLLPFQAHAMDPGETPNNSVMHKLFNQEYMTGNCEIQEADKSTYILPYKPRNSSSTFNIRYTGIPQEFPHENRLARLSNAQDKRAQIMDTALWPYVLHAQLSLHFSNGEYGGSAMMVGPHHMLTTARNVYNPETNEWVEKIIARIALNDTQVPFGEIKVANIYTFKEWIENESPEFDMALLTLPDSIGNRIGWAGLLAEEDAILMQKDIHVTGYPGDKGFNQLWTMTHHINKLQEERIFFKKASYDGQGGGVSWINQYGVPYVIGLHTLGGGNLYGNHSGVRLSRNKLKILKKWIDATWENYQTSAFSFGAATSPAFNFSTPAVNFSFTSPAPSRVSYGSTGVPVLSSFSTAESLAFDKWRKGLLNIEKPWAKLLWEKCNDQNLTILELSYSSFKFSSKPAEEGTKLQEEGTVFLLTGNFPKLMSLSLDDNDIGDIGVKALSNGNLLFLRFLSLDGNKIGAEGIKFLANANFTNLDSLSLNNNKIDNEGAKFLANNTLTQLTSLNLSSNTINIEGISLLATGNFSNLSSLELSNNNIGDAEAATLSNGIFPSLTTLSLKYNRIGTEGALFLANGNFTRLRMLSLNNNKLNFEALKFLLDGNFSQLDSLLLDDNKLLDAGVKAFKNSKLSPSLTFLSLNKNKIGLEGLRSLAISHFSHLTKLCLNENNMMDEGAKVFSQGTFPRLKSLEVMYNNLGDEGAKFFLNSNLLSLEKLKLFETFSFKFASGPNLQSNQITDGMKLLLKKRFKLH